MDDSAKSTDPPLDEMIVSHANVNTNSISNAHGAESARNHTNAQIKTRTTPETKYTFFYSYQT
jgi:hypothetical protein